MALGLNNLGTDPKAFILWLRKLDFKIRIINDKKKSLENFSFKKIENLFKNKELFSTLLLEKGD